MRCWDARQHVSDHLDSTLRDTDTSHHWTSRDLRCLVAGRWTGVGESSGVDIGGDATSESGEASAVVRHGGRVELESFG